MSTDLLDATAMSTSGTDAVATPPLATRMTEVGERARTAARDLATARAERKHAALIGMIDAIRRRTDEILTENAEDVARGTDKGLSRAFIDRLTLSPSRIEGIIDGVKAIADLPDPVGSVISSWTQPNGLEIERVRTPLGVIGVIFESRPNVAVDAGALCLKAGNATILRPGSDSHASSAILTECMTDGLRQAGLPEAAIQMVPTRDRDAVGMMLTGLNGDIDVIVPRGGRSLVERARTEARVPVFAHLEGICHVYVHAPCDLEMAREVTVNAKMRRTGICGAAETLLVDKSIAASHVPVLVAGLRATGCVVRGDAGARTHVADLEPANEADWTTEYLDSIISLRIVDGLDEAVDHIETYGSHHTDCILTDDTLAAARFLNNVDSAIVMHNASTQFADGGEFGMGAEIGIATGRMHARGPVGLEQLTSFKYRVRGNGQIRP